MSKTDCLPVTCEKCFKSDYVTTRNGDAFTMPRCGFCGSELVIDGLPSLAPGLHLVGNRPLDMTTFAGRAFAVKALKMGTLKPHTCCPQCRAQDPNYNTVSAFCPRCGWQGRREELMDTVEAGATRIPGG